MIIPIYRCENGYNRNDGEITKLFVEPALQGNSIGSTLLKYAIDKHDVNTLWVLGKNVRAIRVYERHGFKLQQTRNLKKI
ncbi:MAG: GNAT family N-acetyltransferase [Lachnospiraceae bacterium]|nr:GNAT family N-acetyltransferase [Lachnospiraceae bacterium]